MSFNYVFINFMEFLDCIEVVLFTPNSIWNTFLYCIYSKIFLDIVLRQKLVFEVSENKIQPQNQGYEYAYWNIYLIYELLEHVKGARFADQKQQNFHISITQGRYPIGLSVRAQYHRWSKSQKPRTRPMTHCNEHLLK